MSGQKWTVVGGTGGKKGISNQSATKEHSARKIGGLQESTGAFVKFTSLNDDEEEAATIQPQPIKEATRTSKRLAASSSTEGVTKKKATTRKPKVQYNFDEFVRELNPNTLIDLTQEARQKYPDNPQNLLKEVTGQVQVLFEEVEVEREFAFTNRTPGYPLAALSGACQEPLLSVIHSCPPLVQEAIFRYCVDQLLTEVRAGLPSYGTRLILQLLIQCKPSTCTECVQKIKILLQSSLSKVSEALSLLWAGLPHPQLHLVPALEAWPELCLPILYSTPNVPRQVLNYIIDYTCILLQSLGAKGGRVLASKLPPMTLCALLASPYLSTRRTQTNVQEMLHKLQTTLIESSSDKEVGEYFTAVFKRLTEDKLSQVGIPFVICCLTHSVTSVKLWAKLFSSLPLSSQLVLKELASQEQLSPNLPLHELSVTLTHIVDRGSPEEKTLAQGLLTRHKGLFRTSRCRKAHREADQSANSEEGWWCSGCGFLLVLLSIAYICVLSVFLYHLAKNGPSQTAALIQQYLPVEGEWVHLCTDAMWKGLSMFVSLLYRLRASLF